jgi:hypothetical protein
VVRSVRSGRGRSPSRRTAVSGVCRAWTLASRAGVVVKRRRGGRAGGTPPRRIVPRVSLRRPREQGDYGYGNGWRWPPTNQLPAPTTPCPSIWLCFSLFVGPRSEQTVKRPFSAAVTTRGSHRGFRRMGRGGSGYFFATAFSRHGMQTFLSPRMRP